MRTEIFEQLVTLLGLLFGMMAVALIIIIEYPLETQLGGSLLWTSVILLAVDFVILNIID
jgi:hypothetical protein